MSKILDEINYIIYFDEVGVQIAEIDRKNAIEVLKRLEIKFENFSDEEFKQALKKIFEVDEVDLKED